MEYKDYYRIMGVKRDATRDEIKRAYRTPKPNSRNSERPTRC